MSDMSKRTDEELGRALKTLGRNMPAPQGVGLLDRVETELTGETRNPRRGFRVEWRTLAVAAMALAVAGAGTLLVLRAFGTRPNAVGTEPAGGFHALWPETSWDDAVAAQERVDGGEDDWRRAAPEATALMFVQDALGWSDPGVTLCRENPNVPRYLQRPCLEGADQARVFVQRQRGGPLDQQEWVLDMARLVRSGEKGIWSITAVSVGEVSTDVEPGDVVRLGTSVGFNLPGPADQDWLLATYIFRRDCGIQSMNGEWENRSTGEDLFTLTPADLEACSGQEPAPLDQPAPGFLVAGLARGGIPPFVTGGALFDGFNDPTFHFKALVMIPVELLPAAMDPSPTVTPSPSPSPQSAGNDFVFVWPELRWKDAVATQKAADLGEASLQWRLDPAQVASRLVSDFMMRDVVDVQVASTGADLAYDVVDSLGYHEIVTVEQPVRNGDGGIYSVVNVYSGNMQLDRIEVRPDGSAIVDGTVKHPGARIGYYLHRACPDAEEGCGSDSILLTTSADANGVFHIEIAPDSIERSGALAVWIVTDDAGWQDLAMQYIPPGPYSA